LGQSRGGRKNIYLGSPDVVLVHPQNELNFLILNWCIGGCWFTPTLDQCFKEEGGESSTNERDEKDAKENNYCTP
jgi:hypothetical protein